MPTLRDAVRHLWRNIGFTLTAVLTLGIGIGLVATQFSLIDGTFLRPLPFAEGERLYHITTQAIGDKNQRYEWMSFDEFAGLRAQQQSFDGFAAFVSETYNLVPAGGAPQRLWGSAVSGDFFPMLRVNPVLGRLFDPGADRPGQPLRAVIAYGLWRDVYAADPQVIGQTIRLNGETATIIAVMPQSFGFPSRESVWVNLRAAPAVAGVIPPPDVEVLGRLKPGLTTTSAAAELDSAARHIWQSLGKAEADRLPIRIARFQDDYNGGNTGAVLYTMLAMTAFVLLLACINVAGLLSVRAADRVRELAVRSALGARRRHVLWQLLAESLSLAALGALLGVALAGVGVHLLQTQVRARVDMPEWMYFDLNPRVLLFTVAVAVVAGVLAGVLPALRALRVDPAIALRGEGRGSVGPRSDRSGRWLMVGQLAFACAAMVMAALFAISAIRSSKLSLAFDPDSLLIGRVELQGLPYVDAASRVRFYNTLVERVQQTPGVVAAAASSRDLVDSAVSTRLEIAGSTYPREQDKPQAFLEVVTRDYFAVVNRSFAVRHWPGMEPIGQRIRRSEDGAQWATVVGVVPDLNMRGINNPVEEDGWYLLQDQVAWGWLELLVRTSGDPAALIDSVRAAVAAIDPDQPVHSIGTLRARTERRVAPLNIIGSMAGVFAIAALILAAIGTYGVMAYGARLRSRELGLRVALGASRGGVIGLMLRQNLWSSTLGVACGLALGYGVSYPLAPMLPEVSNTEPLIYLVVASVLLAAALLACWLPARRAAAVDPMLSLRGD